MWDSLGSEGTFSKATTAQPKRLPSISQQLCQSYFSQNHSPQQLFTEPQPTKHTLIRLGYVHVKFLLVTHSFLTIIGMYEH
jgi:hypothetical protein